MYCTNWFKADEETATTYGVWSTMLCGWFLPATILQKMQDMLVEG